MRNLIFLFILGATLLTQNLHAQYTLTLRLHDMDPYIGHRFEVRVTEQPSGKEVGRKAIDTLQSDTATLLLYVFLEARNYRVDFYADVNGNASYNAPPTDHAWRRTVSNTTANVVIDFTPDVNYTDIGFPDAFPYSQYRADWGGKWMNQTFGSTDSITAYLDLRCDSIFGAFETKGVFGNPDPVTFNYAGAVPSDTASSDTIRYTVPAPWTGDIIVVNGDIIGNISQAGVGLVFQGTLGEKQILCLYTVIFNGNPFANGYFYVRELDIISSAPPFELSYIQIDATCAGVCNGYIDLMPTGGTPPYEFIWFNGLSSEDYPNACAGPGDVTVLDAGGCSAEISFTIYEPNPMNIELIPIQPSCHGLCDGVVNITVTGGAPPFVYTWITTPPSGCAGEYILQVTDSNGCTSTATTVLTEPAPFFISNLIVENPTSGQDDGSITVIASGGIPPLSYSINGSPYQASNFFTGLPPGTHEVCVKDASGCIVCQEVTLEEMVAVQDLDYAFILYPNPVRNTLHIESDIPIAVSIMDLHGKLMKVESFKTDHELLITDYPVGMYIVKVSDGYRSSYKKIIRN